MAESERARLEREYVEAGFDLSLLDATLRMTPDERLRAHESAARVVEELRAALEERRARLRRNDPTEKDRDALRELELIRARLKAP